MSSSGFRYLFERPAHLLRELPPDQNFGTDEILSFWFQELQPDGFPSPARVDLNQSFLRSRYSSDPKEVYFIAPLGLQVGIASIRVSRLRSRIEYESGHYDLHVEHAPELMNYAHSQMYATNASGSRKDRDQISSRVAKKKIRQYIVESIERALLIKPEIF